MEPKPWIKQYDAGVPPTLQPYPARTLLDILADNARERPNHPGLLFKGAKISYADLERLSDACAAALVGCCITKGDRVALIMPNSPQMVIAMFGAWKAGAIVVPINPLYTAHEIKFALNESSAKTAIVLTTFYNKVKEIQSSTRLTYLIASNIKEYLPGSLRLLFTLFKEKKEGHAIELESDDFWLKDLMRLHARDSRPKIRLALDDPAVLLFSGGTTGVPKAAVLTHHALLISGIQLQAWFSSLLKPWDDIITLNLPLFHVYALAGVFTIGLVNHNPLALIPNPRDLDDTVSTITKVHPAFLPGVPTLFNSLLDHPKVVSGKADISSLKLCISGAAPLLEEIRNRFESATGGRIVEGYALTESAMACVISPVFGHRKPGAVGLPLPDVEVRIVDADTGEIELSPNEVGEIVMRAPQLMAGYWQSPTETHNTLRDGWLFTGDLGYLDEEGYVYIVDRKKDVIKVSGFQVWPREVEEVIASHPAVAEVGVAGVLDPQQGEIVKAWVVLRAGETLSVDDLRIFCKAKLAAYKVPRNIEFRTSLPKSTVGKILRRELASETIAQRNEENLPH